MPALRTEVMIIALINDPATLDPTIWKTMVKGEVAESLVDRPGVV